MDKNRLRDSIYDAIALEPKIKNVIDVEVEGDIVKLRGVVSSQEERRLAADIALKQGAKALDIGISIEEGSRTHDVGAAVDRALREEGLSSVAGVDRVKDGIIYLSGHATSAAEAERAIDVSAATSGVRDVVSEIRLAPKAAVDDVVLVNRIEQAIVDAGVHEENISAWAHDGIVYLEGIAWRGKDKEQAEKAAKEVPGVRGVVNRLRSPAEPLSEDERIAWNVLRRLESQAINVINMNVVVAGGTAFLDGSVDSEKQKDLAGEVALSTPGVLNIKNDLSVSSLPKKAA